LERKAYLNIFEEELKREENAMNEG